MDENTRAETIKRITKEHGCEVQPTAFGRTAIVRAAQHRQGDPRDGEAIAACRLDLKRAGISNEGWVS